MFGISTAWQSKVQENGKDLIQELIRTGIPGVELEYRITVDMFKQMKDILKSGEIKVLSVHNYFPHPEILPKQQASGDALCLSAVDEDERNCAIKYALRSIQNAHDLEARAVVFHLGNIELDTEKETWLAMHESGKYKEVESQEFIKNKLKIRKEKHNTNFDAVLFSVDRLHEEAIKRNVMLGIENRFFWNEIPDFDEIGILLNKFAGGNIGYWHDCGHAQVWQNLGIIDHEKFLRNYSPYLIGIHLHDCNGHNDHIAPGYGKIDFDMIKKYLPENAIRIIEVHNKVSFDELKQGISFLKERKIL